jgi:phage terminase large subunit-like protein
MSATKAPLLSDPRLYPRLLCSLQKRPEAEQAELARSLCQTDLYFLLRYGCSRKDIERQWLFERCREVQDDPDGRLDLWAREHYKSTIITFGLTVQEVLNDPEITVGIFSHTRPIAKAFLRQIKWEFESNEFLKALFPDILWANPQKESPKWSEDEGIIVKRKTNPKEATIEAWGLVDGQPTSKHYRLLTYDDVVTDKSVTTPDMIAKTTDALSLSYNLGAAGGKRRFIGTRYHFNDTYGEVMRRGTATPRIHRATTDGRPDGEPVLLTREILAGKRKDQGPYIFSCQMLQNPVADEAQGFKEGWLQLYHGTPKWRDMNRYIVVDAASSKKKESDYTVMWVIGLAGDGNYYALDVVRDRLNLTERADTLFALHRKWHPKHVGYERYGMMADVEHMRDRMGRDTYHFEIIELGGPMPKPDRIKRLIPLFETNRVLLPAVIRKRDSAGQMKDLTRAFIDEEYLAFPVSMHDDMLDAMARIVDEDMRVMWPMQYEDVDSEPDEYGRSGTTGY